MSKDCQKGKSTLKGIRFPAELLAEIEAAITNSDAGENFSSWVLNACKHQLNPQPTTPDLQTDAKIFQGTLTAQKKKFADYLMKGLNQSESAILAGYSEKSAKVKGCQLAKDPAVLAYIASQK